MRNRGKALTLALLCVAGLVAAAVSFGAVVGERGTRIISPPGGSPSADGPSDSTGYTDDGSKSGSATPTTNPVVGGPRPMDNLEFSQDNRQVRYAAFDSKAKNLIVSQASYEVTDPTVDSQIVTLQSSGADTFFNITTPKFAAQAIRKAFDTGWKPVPT